MSNAKDVIKNIAQTFIDKLEQFDGKWEKPFFSGNTGFAVNVKSREFYNGINQVILYLTQDQRGYTSNKWATFKQWEENKRYVAKGEQGTHILFFKPLKYKQEVKNEEGEIVIEEHQTFVARAYVVFNECQLKDYEPPKVNTEISEDVANQVKEFKENFLDKTGIVYQEGKSSACYIPSIDEVHLPSLEQFKLPSEYIPTACHEFTHATGAKHRLNRDFSGKFGDESYAFEELVADIGAGLLSAHFGKAYIFQNNNLAYIKSWLKVLKDKPSAIISACSYAQKSTDYLLGLVESK